MRIAPFIISLFASVTLYAQSADRVSTNIEPRRSVVTPYASLEELDSDKSGVMRYSIALPSWTQSATPPNVTFSSSFDSPFSWLGRQSIISISSASAPYTVFVDGREVGSNFTPSLPAQFNVTRYLKEQAISSVDIELHPNATTQELEGWGSDNSLQLGEVVMISQPTMYLRDIEVETSLSEGMLNATVALIIKSEALNARVSRIAYELVSPQGKVVARGNSDVTLGMRGEDTLRMSAIIPDSLAWSADNPNLFRVNVSTQYRGRYVEYQGFDVGLRSLEVSGDGTLIVNGKQQSLNALSVGADATRYQLSMAKSAGYNTIKFAAGEHPMELYNYADSIGLYVVATAPINTSHSGGDILRGGNPTNDPERLGEYLERVDAIYNTTKLHPSVIAFALSDSSLNGINLYESYLYLKRRESQRPIIYIDSDGEWNNDPLKIDF